MEEIGRTDLLAPEEAGRSDSRAAGSRVEVLRKIYSALDSVLFEIETSGGPKCDFARAINFYDEVRQFEISLIRQALRHARGSQVKAAALLGLNRTTLNAKIKNYSIG